MNSRLSDRKSTRLNSSHDQISYAVFCLKKKKKSVLLRSDRKSTRLNSSQKQNSYPEVCLKKKQLVTPMQCSSGSESDQPLPLSIHLHDRDYSTDLGLAIRHLLTVSTLYITSSRPACPPRSSPPTLSSSFFHPSLFSLFSSFHYFFFFF